MLLVLTLQFCGGRIYTDPVFVEKTMGHRIIAVLPYEMVFTGKKPKKLSVQQVRKIEEVESIAFQNSFYNSLLRQTTKRRNPIRIDIQSTRQTNRILERNNIGIRESWDMESLELARMLKVDAVVRTRVEKRRFMSGLASFGLELGTDILNALLEDTPLMIFLPTTTNQIKAGCYLCDGRDGAVLWSLDIVDETDWRMTADEIIDGVNFHFARKFPYR
jgi:hypothetical protein